MTQPPDFLPEERPQAPPTPPKRKNEERTPPGNNSPITRSGCLLTVFMLIIGILLGGIIAFLALPLILEQTASPTPSYDATVEALEAQEALLQEQVFYLQQTSAALGNEGELLQQTEVQISRNIAATQTAINLSNERMATQIALDYVATQAALQRNATQVELNFQSTRTAIEQRATDSAQPEG